MKTVLIFTRLDEPIVYDNSIEATELDEISCDRSSMISPSKQPVKILLCCRFWVSNE